MGDSNNNPAGAVASPTLHIGSGMHVFLQTAKVNVSIPGKELSHSLTVRAIFDTGAQRSCEPKGSKRLEIENCQDRETENCNIWGSEPRAGSCQPGRTFFNQIRNGL